MYAILNGREFKGNIQKISFFKLFIPEIASKNVFNLLKALLRLQNRKISNICLLIDFKYKCKTALDCWKHRLQTDDYRPADYDATPLVHFYGQKTYNLERSGFLLSFTGYRNKRDHSFLSNILKNETEPDAWQMACSHLSIRTPV
jgi:hypothetical protein